MIGSTLIFAATVFAQHPLNHVSNPIPHAPPLPPVGRHCVQVLPRILPSEKDMPTISPTITVSPEHVVFHGLLQNALLEGKAKSSAARSGYLYLRLDEGQPMYLGFYPGGDPRGTQIFVGLPGMREGLHSLDFGFVGYDSTAYSYGRFCFAVRPGVELNYSLP